MKMNNFLLILVSFLCLPSCAKYNVDDLKGHWEAAVVLEEGEPLAINNADVQFVFKEGGIYEYASTLNYQEMGMFKIEKDLLFTKDTINKDAEEKAVRIKTLTRDSLFLEMMDGGKQRLLKLYKKGD